MLRSWILIAALSLVSTAAAGNSAGFDDPAGDVVGTPDIVHAAATSTDSGRLTFRTTFAAPPSFGNGFGFALLVDADADPSTGHSDGVDYWFIFRTADGGFEPGVWDGQQFVPYASRATGSISGDTVTITVPAGEIAAGKTIRYLLASYKGTEEDLAPDSSGGAEVFATFALKLRPPVSVRFVPRAPRAGASFRAVGTGLRCRAALAGRALRRGCRWSLPVSAHRKRLVVTVTNRAGRSRRFVFRVR
jgi:hypothetical protein